MFKYFEDLEEVKWETLYFRWGGRGEEQSWGCRRLPCLCLLVLLTRVAWNGTVEWWTPAAM